MSYNITFSKIRMKNLATVGDNWLELDLNHNGTTLIYGSNGTGKSSIALDAIMFALYNKPFKKIKIGELVNNINNRGMIVELTFHKGGKEYLIKRGYKPALFEIYIDDVLLDKETAHQEYLEKHIITVPYNTFKQIVVMGKANYVSFLDLAKDKRREFVETILDLSAIRTMLDNHKVAVKDTENKLTHTGYLIDSTKKQLDTIKGYIEAHKKQKNDETSNQLNQIKDEIEEHKKAINDIDLSKYPNVDDVDVEIAETMKHQHKVDMMRAKFDSKVDELKKQIKFLESNQTCPTCQQVIDDEFKGQIIDDNNSNINDLNKKIGNLIELSEKDAEALSELNETMRNIEAVNLTINANKSAILRLERDLEYLLDKKNNSSDEVLNKYKSDLKELLDKFKELNAQHKELEKKSRVNASVSNLLSDKGIKSIIINRYIKQFNSLVNSFLQKFNLFASIEFDVEFNDVIKKRGFDEYSYNQLSEGEKLRFDLSIMLAWREIASLKSNLSINLLILDEIFNASLDYEGCKAFIDILHSKNGQSTIIVSPNADEIMDLCSQKIGLQKVNNFVRMIDA